MTRPLLLAAFFLVAIILRWTYSQEQSQSIEWPGTYTVIAPAKLRPNLEYHVSVSVHEVSSPVRMSVSVLGPSDNGNYNSVSKSIVLNPLETRILNFDIGEWGPGKYNLSVSGSGGLVFSNETELTFEHKSYSVFVQTDKAIYKPGQLVNFRVIVVNPYLLPTVTGAISMYITDAGGNRIKQWDRVFTSRGVVTESLQLSDQPVLGDWTIHVDVLGQTFKKSFTVAEYVLPTFYVEVDLPPYATYNKSDVVATVRATYTYGKPVKGEVTLSVAPQTRYNYLSVRPYETFQTKTQIDGSVDIPLNLMEKLNLKTDFFEREIEFFALVEESLTGRKYNKTNSMKIYDKDIKVELIKTSESFKPGLKYTCFLKVAYQDDTPVNDKINKLKLMYGYSYDEKSWQEEFYTVPTNGLIKLEFIPPNKNDISVLGLRAEFRKQIYYLESVDAALSPSLNFIQAILLTENPRVGGEAEVEVSATEPMDQLVVEVMGRGDIVFAQTFNVGNSKAHHFSFAVTHRMAPKARIVAYYVRKENSEVVADAVNFEVDGVFRTPVSVETDVAETKPGSSVSVTVKTKPSAYIGVLGIDQSTLLLKSGNDITQQDVIKELGTYDGGKSNKFWPPWYESRRKRSLWWPGSTTASEIFKDSGVVILTNGLVHNFEPMIFYRMNPVQQTAFIDDGEISYDSTANQNNLKHKNDEPGSIKLRKHFPETWLWNMTSAGTDGTAVIRSSIPDTITSWIVSAFAMDSITGLGIAANTAKVTVFRPFFIKLNLPYSVIRGESVAVQIIVFNYLNKPIQAEVTLQNKKGQFDFTVAGNDVANPVDLDQKSKVVSVPAQDGSSVSFLITPRQLGYVDIKVTAVSDLAGDSVLKKLLVKPEGTPQYFNKAFLIDLRNPTSFPIKSNISLPIPNNAVPGSERITVSAIGDVLGPSVNNLDQLLRMPSGCGEQNMLNFVPNIVILDYLTRANRLTGEIKRKALRHIESGYQRELTYKRNDGSFSAFGNSDKNGSTWLTAFVVKSFHQAKQYIDMDENVTTQAIEWLINSQNPDGSFTEKGEIHNKAMQGGSASGISLTAYVLIALLENEAQKDHAEQVNRAHDYLARMLRTTDDPYVVTIATYALHLMDSPSKEGAYQKMMSLSKTKGEVVYWSKSGEKNVTDKQSDHFYLPASVDIEMTSYALLVHVIRTDDNRALPILKWLVSQQNENGGFASTQDTVIGVQALGQLAARIVSHTINIDIACNFGEERRKELRIGVDNAMVLQKLDVPTSVRSIEIESKGFGVAVVQVSWSYNLAVSAEQPAFFLNALLDKTSTESYLQLSVCTQNREDLVSNMAVMEVVLPSGYLADVDALPSIHQTSQVKRVETKDGDTNVVIYFDRITKKELCVTVPAHRSFKVAHQKPVPVKVYDYYNLAKSARLFYQPREATLCDICEGDECGEGCNVLKDSRDDGGKGNGASMPSSSASSILVVFGALSIYLRST